MIYWNLFRKIDLVLQKEFFLICLNLETNGNKSRSLSLTMDMHCVDWVVWPIPILVPNSFREINVIEQFINGLGSYDLKKHVSLNHPKSLVLRWYNSSGYGLWGFWRFKNYISKTKRYEESGVRSVSAKVGKEKSLENDLRKQIQI